VRPVLIESDLHLIVRPDVQALRRRGISAAGSFASPILFGAVPAAQGRHGIDEAAKRSAAQPCVEPINPPAR